MLWMVDNQKTLNSYLRFLISEVRGQEDARNLLQLLFLIESIFCEVHHPSLSDPISKLHHAKQVDSVSCILQDAENNMFRGLKFVTLNSHFLESQFKQNLTLKFRRL
jgi:hypothetical protein